jgi:hypothetical protein
MASVVILPWISPRKRFELSRDVVLLPCDDAIATLSAAEGEQLRYQSQIFYNSYTVENFVSEVRRIRPESDAESVRYEVASLQPMTPTSLGVVILDDSAQAWRKARTAIHAFAFGTIVESQRYFVSNGAAFQMYYLRLGGVGDGFVTIDTRMTLFGRTLDAIDPTNRIEMRPRHVPRDVSLQANLGFVAAVIGGAQMRKGRRLRRALESLQTAFSYAPEVTEDLQRSLCAHAIELILDRGTQDWKSRQIDLLKPLFLRRINGSDRRRKGRKWLRLLRTCKAIREDRNSFWHPKPRRSRDGVSCQLLVTPLHVAALVTYALLIARLVELGTLPIDSAVVTDVYAITDWLAYLSTRPDRGLVHPADVDRTDRRAWAEANIAWNDAAEEASHWQRFRSHEQLLDGVARTIARIRAVTTSGA